METKNIPIIVMLTAAFVASVVMYVNNYDLSVMLKAILLIFLVFYILGVFVKRLLDAFCPLPKKEEGKEEGEETEEKEEETAEGKQTGEDGSVIEKK